MAGSAGKGQDNDGLRGIGTSSPVCGSGRPETAVEGRCSSARAKGKARQERHTWNKTAVAAPKGCGVRVHPPETLRNPHGRAEGFRLRNDSFAIPDYSPSSTSPSRKRATRNDLPSLAHLHVAHFFRMTADPGGLASPVKESC